MRYLTIILCFLFFLSLPLTAQETYFNEWIDYSKTYHKFRIAEDGLYRIPYSALQEVGLAEKNSEGFHLFSRGEEIPIYISSNEMFGSDDFIEFYGQKNAGSFDTQLFQNPDWQLTDRQSLFTDSIGYYLMWDDSFEGKRIEMVENDLSGELPEKEAYFMYESGRTFRNIFFGGTPTRVHSMERPNGVHVNFADFEKGEGFVSSIIRGERTKIYSLPTLGVYRGTTEPLTTLHTKMVGQSNDEFVENDHHLKLQINGKTYLDAVYEGYETPIFETTIEENDLNDVRTEIEYESVGDLFHAANSDWQSISHVFLTYPRQFDFSVYANGEVKDTTEFYFELQHFNEAYFEVSNFKGGNQPVLYDLSNHQRFEVETADDLYKIHLPESASIQGDSRKLFLTNTDEEVIKTISSLQSIQFTNYQQLTNQGNYIIISHPSLRVGTIDWVQSYGTYRSTSNGGNHSVVIADIEELYDQFSHGILKHPLAIRHFVNFARDKWSRNAEYLFLIGKGIGYRATTTPSSFNDNLVPTFGHQPSDVMLAVRNIFDYRPQLGVGRLSARTPEDVKNYLQKIQQYENIEQCTIADRAWRKQALFQSGSNVEEEIPLFEAYLADYQEVLEDVSFGGKVLDVQANLAYSSNFHTTPFIEQGIGIMQYSGHATGQNWKTGLLENPTGYNQNTPRFPVILSAGSFVGDIFRSTNAKKSLSEFWISAESKGAIGFLGQVSFDWRESEDLYLTELYRQFSLNNFNQPIGKCLKETIQNVFIGNPNAELYDMMKTNVQTFVFEGDPALVIGGDFDRPEYVINNNYHYSFIDKENGYVRKTEKRNDVELLDSNGELLQLENDVFEVNSEDGNLQLKLRVTNLGKAVLENFNIQVSRQIVGETEIEVLMEENVASPLYEENHWFILPYSQNTVENVLYEYVVRIDSNNDIEEDCEDNNEVIVQIRFSTCASVEPQYENLQILNLQSNYCITDPAFQLQANIAGGTFAVEQIGGPTYHVNIFQPSQLGGGDYIATYTLIDEETGCVFTTETLTTIIEPIAAIESIDLTEVCVGDAIQINAASTEGNYIWDFGHGNFSGTSQNPSISWDSAGEKTISLKVVEDGCESTTVSQMIEVYPQVAENFPIYCQSTDSSVSFNWEADGATGFLVYRDDVLIQSLPSTQNTFTFSGLEPEQVVSITVVAVPGGTCEEVVSTISCKATCSSYIPILELAETYCGSHPVFIFAPAVNGTFTIDNPDGSTTTITEDHIFSTIFQEGISTIAFEYTMGLCTYTSVDYQVTVGNPEVHIEGDDVLCPDWWAASIEVPDTFAEYQWNVPNENDFMLEIEEVGIYSVTVTDFYGCTATDEIELREAEDPEGQILTSTGETVLCEGEIMNLAAPLGYESYIWIGNISVEPFIQITEAGEYYVDYEDENNCNWRAYITIEAAAIPEIEVISNQGEGVVLLAVLENFEEYLWNTGETSSFIEVTANGTYTVTTTDEFGCISMASVDVVITDIEETDQNLAIEVYPNPFEEELIIEGKTLKGSWLQLYDLQGRLVISKQIKNKVETLDLKELSNGMYLLKVVAKEGFWSEKVVKK